MPYDRSVDVYSFGIMLWEMSSLEKPFAGYNSKKHMSHVVIAGERPKMDNSHVSLWPLELQWVMKSAWNSDPDARPTFKLIIHTLKNVIDELKAPKLDRMRARSEGSHVDFKKNDDGAALSPTRKTRPLLKMTRLITKP